MSTQYGTIIYLNVCINALHFYSPQTNFMFNFYKNYKRTKVIENDYLMKMLYNASTTIARRANYRIETDKK